MEWMGEGVYGYKRVSEGILAMMELFCIIVSVIYWLCYCSILLQDVIVVNCTKYKKDFSVIFCNLMLKVLATNSNIWVRDFPHNTKQCSVYQLCHLYSYTYHFIFLHLLNYAVLPSKAFF